LQTIVVDDVNGTFFVRFLSEGGGSVRAGSQVNGFLPAPVIGNFSGAISYTENGASIPIGSSATITDVDSPNFSQGVLRINLKSGGSSDDRLRIRTQGTGAGQINVQGNQVRTGTVVLGTFTGGVGTTPLVVTLTGQATAYRVQLILGNVVFYNVSDKPTTAVRTLRVSVSDSDGYLSAPAFKKISVIAVNDAPQLGLSGSISYARDAGAIYFAAAATVGDVDSANFSGGRLRVRITGGASSSNRLAIGAGFTIDAHYNVLRNGVIIGQRTSNGYAQHELIITFNTKVTPSIAQQLVRAITFQTVGGSAGQRTILFSLSDGDGGLSAEANRTVNVT
jgi:hypothetical protein